MSRMNGLPEVASALRLVADALESLTLQTATPQHGPELRRLLSAADAAAYLGLSKRTLALLAADGSVLQTRIGARVLYDLQDLDRFIDRVQAAR